MVIGENQDLMHHILYADHVNFMSVAGIKGDQKVMAKIRYNHKGAPAVIRMIEDDLVECVFEEPQRAMTPGQAVVFYDGENVLGGGTIKSSR